MTQFSIMKPTGVRSTSASTRILSLTGGGGWMRSLLLLVILATTGLGAAHAEGKPSMLFLLAGQSNMDGKGAVGELEAPFVRSPANVTIWKDGRWEPLTPSGKWFGPEVGFAHACATMMPGRDIRLVKYSVSGTSLYKDWAPSNGPKYRGFMESVRSALKHLDASGVSYEIGAMLWLQGENDAMDGKGDVYEENLTRFIARIREEFRMPSMPFVIARVLSHYGGENGHARLVRDAQEAIARKDPRCACFDTDDCGLHDRGHYNAAGQLLVGRRFAEGFRSASDAGH